MSSLVSLKDLMQEQFKERMIVIDSLLYLEFREVDEGFDAFMLRARQELTALGLHMDTDEGISVVYTECVDIKKGLIC